MLHIAISIFFYYTWNAWTVNYFSKEPCETQAIKSRDDIKLHYGGQALTTFSSPRAGLLIRLARVHVLLTGTMGYPGGSDGKESACQCRQPGFDPWVGRAQQPTPVFLPGESHGQRSLVGSQRIRHDWATFTFFLNTKNNKSVQDYKL